MKVARMYCYVDDTELTIDWVAMVRRAERVNAIVAEIKVLVAVLRGLALEEEDEEEEEREEDPADVTGWRVRITRRDRFRGRYGRVVSARGQMFWNIMLEADDRGRPAELIYKTRDGFVLV